MGDDNPAGPRFIPPDAETLEALGSIPGVRFTPGTVTGQAGPKDDPGLRQQGHSCFSTSPVSTRPRPGDSGRSTCR